MSRAHLLLKNKNRNRHKGALDKVVYVVAFAAPLFELPQLYKVYSDHSAKDVSVITWGCFALASCIWLTYAVRHRIKPLIISYLLFSTIELITFIGILIYR